MPNIELDVQRFTDPEGHEREWVTLTAYGELTKELQALRADNQQLRKGRSLLDSEVEEIKKIREENEQRRDELNEITVFVREQYAREIALGRHNNMRSIGDVVIHYLGIERSRMSVMVRGWLWRFTR